MKIVRNEKGEVTKECLCEIHRSLPIAAWEEGKDNIMYIDEYSWDFFVRELVVYLSFTDWEMIRMVNISNVESAILKELNKIENAHNIRIPLVSKGSILSRIKNALVCGDNKNKTTIMKVKFKRLNDLAKVPTKANVGDAGFDLTATSRRIDEYGNYVYGTGVAVEIPPCYVGLVFPRSSISRIALSLTNSVGVIDSGYRGEIMAKFFRRPDGFSAEDTDYKIGDRIAQLVILPLPQIELEEVDKLTDSERGVGGFGSSGK